MRKLIKKMVKLELEAKNTAFKNFQNAPNRGYNPQYRRPPLQILPRESKEQQDQVPHPLYLEGLVDDSTEDAAYGLEDANLSFSNSDGEECPLQGNEGVECPLQEEEKTRDTEEAEIDHYCKKIANFMQAQFNRRYDLRSSRKRTRTQDQEAELPQKEAPAQKESTMQKVTDKGKGPLKKPLQSNDQIPSSSKVVIPPNTKSVSK